MSDNYATILLRALKRLDDEFRYAQDRQVAYSQEEGNFVDLQNQLYIEILWRQNELADQIKDGNYPNP